MKSRLLPSLVVIIALIGICQWVYVPAFNGPFLFDDFSNLAPLSRIAGDINPESLRNYLMAGNAGPSGRPLSLLSFLLDAQDWPAAATPFKKTNLALHLINSLLLLWLVMLLITCLKETLPAQHRNSPQLIYIAAVVVMFWSLNPYHLSAVMYVVQRMALLASLFVLSGLILYIKGRILLNRDRTVLGYFLVWTGFFLATVVGVLAKENAVVFVLLVPITEWLVFKNKSVSKDSLLRLTIWLPLITFCALLVWLWPDHKLEYTSFRDFNLSERLLTQGRALGYYLWRYLVPGVSYIGIFGDGMENSISLWHPLSTLLWWAVHLLLIGLALLLRWRYPLFSIGVLFFYAAHALESGHVPIELFFEHRNYLPSALLLLGVFHLPWQRITWLAALLVLIFLALLGRIQAGYWGSEHDIKLIMMTENPTSARATMTFADYVDRRFGHADALGVLEAYRSTQQPNVEMALNIIKLRCLLGIDNEADVDMLMQSPHVEVGKAVFLIQRATDIGKLLAKGGCQVLDFDSFRAFLKESRKTWPESILNEQSIMVAMAKTYEKEGNYDKFLEYIYQAMDMRDAPELNISVCEALVSIGNGTDACECYRKYYPEGEIANYERGKFRHLYGYGDKIIERFELGRMNMCNNIQTDDL